jgi:hypothetical protein
MESHSMNVASRSGAHVEDMNIDACPQVIEQVPSEMIRIVIEDEVIAANPAPVAAVGPVPQCDLEVETPW